MVIVENVVIVVTQVKTVRLPHQVGAVGVDKAVIVVKHLWVRRAGAVIVGRMVKLLHQVGLAGVGKAVIVVLRAIQEIQATKG